MLVEIQENVYAILKNIDDLNCHHNVMVVAAAKKQTPEKVNSFISAMNTRGKKAIIADNYVQEAVAIKDSLAGDYEHHFIGRLQSNKVRKCIQVFDVIQSVSTKKIAKLISDEAVRGEKIIRIFLQVNISDDEKKSGVNVDELEDLYIFAKELPNIKVSGLMAITAYYNTPENVRKDFANLKNLHNHFVEKYSFPNLELSMGMSSDYLIAIQEGSTMVRIGEKIFGKRDS